MLKQGTDDLNALEEAFGLPVGYIDSLTNEDDWTIIIKSHALIESVCANMLTHYFGEPELSDYFATIEMSNKKTGKAAIISALQLLGKPERSFISTLSELRNLVVHNATNVRFSIAEYISELSKEKRSKVIKSLNIRLAYIEFDGIIHKGDDLVLHFPKQVIWSSLSYCLFKIYSESIFAIERNKLITELLSEAKTNGPKVINPKRITLSIKSNERS